MAPKRKRVPLTIDVKWEIVEKIEKGVPIASLMTQYNIAKSTLYDLKKAKDNLKIYHQSFANKTRHKQPRKMMRKPNHPQLDESVLKWLQQQRTAHVMVRTVELLDAANRFADHLQIKDFKASHGWLDRFKQRHGLSNCIAHGEAGSADASGVDAFRQRLSDFVNRHDLANAQIYNANETGLFWQSTPNNTLSNDMEMKVAGHKKSKQRVSIMCCANASDDSD